MTGGVSASFWYDGTARRRKKTIGSTTTRFLYDGLNLVQELSGGGTSNANLLTGLAIDETFTRNDVSGARSLLIDALGSTLELADASGTLQTHYTYEPFGAATTNGIVSSNPVQFMAREDDSASLLYYRARYYSPVKQRFIAEDPLLQSSVLSCQTLGAGGNDPLSLTHRNSQGMNLYSFVENNPLTYRDPLGLDKCKNETGCPCKQHLEEDWGCFAALTLFASPFYVIMAAGGVAGASHGNIAVAVVTAGVASGTAVLTHRVCLHCVDNKR
jgi:RHS repeat-associated protein